MAKKSFRSKKGLEQRKEEVRLEEARQQRSSFWLEFLMSYGWVILIVLIAIGALVYFGVLNPQNFLPSDEVKVDSLSAGQEGRILAECYWKDEQLINCRMTVFLNRTAEWARTHKDVKP